MSLTPLTGNRDSLSKYTCYTITTTIIQDIIYCFYLYRKALMFLQNYYRINASRFIEPIIFYRTLYKITSKYYYKS